MDKPKILTAKELRTIMPRLSGWKLARNKLSRTFEFQDFVQSLGFVNSLVAYFETVDHHPDVRIVYREVTFELTRYDLGGKVTDRDVESRRRSLRSTGRVGRSQGATSGAIEADAVVSSPRTVAEAPHDLLRFTTRHGEARTRIVQPAARAREDLPRVRLALADGPRDLVEVELENLAQQEDRTFGRRELFQEYEDAVVRDDASSADS